MRIINYDYGYLFDCSIKGKIVVSKQEWLKITKYLFDKRHQIFGTYGVIWYPILAKDVVRGIETKQGLLVNIRVTPTKSIVDAFTHKGKYKHQNYMFLIRN